MKRRESSVSHKYLMSIYFINQVKCKNSFLDGLYLLSPAPISKKNFRWIGFKAKNAFSYMTELWPIRQKLI